MLLINFQTRILVTHSLTYLPRVDHIIVLKNGKVVESGSYTDLLNNKGDFAELISQYHHANDQEPDDEGSMLRSNVALHIEYHGVKHFTLMAR